MHDQDALPVESDAHAAGESWDEASFPEMKPAAVSPFSHPRQPPLGIVHLMVWTALSAIYLGFSNVLLSAAGMNQEGWYRLFRGVEAVLYAPLCGAGLFGLSLTVWRFVNRGVRFPSQPGHWLMVFYGCGICVWMVGASLNTWLIPGFAGYETGGVQRVLAVFVAQNLVSGLLGGVAGWRLRDRWYWRANLWALAVVQVLIGTVCLFLAVDSTVSMPVAISPTVVLSVVNHSGALLFAFALLLTMACELARRVHRDWLHWVGVALGLSFPCLSLADQIARSVLQALVSGSP